MKKKLLELLTVAFILFCNFANAQNKTTEIGISGSPSITTIFGTRGKAITGYSGGIILQQNLNKRLSIHTNLSYERKGFSKYGHYQDVGYHPYGYGFHTAVNQFDYLSTAILLRANTGNKLKFFVNAGPFISYLIKASSNVLYEGSASKESLVQTKNVMRFDYGGTLGLGLSVPIKSKLAISCELRENFGIQNISADANKNSTGYNLGGNITTNSINLLFAITYKISKNNKI
ncbi:MAG: porin family protein [Bacteroidota bacterium]